MSLAGPTEPLLDALTCLDAGVTALGKAYTATKKHPILAVARCPEHMRAVLSGLCAALTEVCAEVDEDVAGDYTSARTLLAELETRVCRTIPVQGVGLSAEEVVAVIRADPAVARAAAAALTTGI